PNLALEKSGPAAVTHGSDIAYTLTVGNNGDVVTAGQITVADTLPAGTTFVSAEGEGWACGEDAGTVTCTTGEAIGAGDQAPPITIVVSPEAGVCGAIVNTATASGGGDPGPDPDASGSATTGIEGCEPE